MKVKSESEVVQSYPTLSDSMNYSLPGSSAHGLFQAGVLEWSAIAFSVLNLNKDLLRYFTLSPRSELMISEMLPKPFWNSKYIMSIFPWSPWKLYPRKTQSLISV